MSQWSTDPETSKVFVYGTLQRGGEYHYLLKQCRARFLAVGRLQTPYPLILAEYPCLLDRPGMGYRVRGEIYEVPGPRAWQVLDHLEGHPEEYRRRVERIQVDQEILFAWTYFYILRDTEFKKFRPVEAFRPSSD